MIRECWASILEELEAMGSGRFVPYHKLSLLVVVVIALLFSLVFRHDAIFEAPVAVIDLDASRYSTHLIEKINSSAYIRITGVYHTTMPVAALTKHDGNVGVLYLPQGLEKEVLSGHRAMNIGYFSDYSNAAQNADVIENLKEITAHEGAQIGVAKVSALGLGATETQAAMNPLSVVNRNLFNPTGSFTTGTTIGFVYFFSSLFYGLTVLMIPGRLRVTGLWQRAVLPRGECSAPCTRHSLCAFLYDRHYGHDGRLGAFRSAAFCRQLLDLCAVHFYDGIGICVARPHRGLEYG